MILAISLKAITENVTYLFHWIYGHLSFKGVAHWSRRIWWKGWQGQRKWKKLALIAWWRSNIEKPNENMHHGESRQILSWFTHICVDLSNLQWWNKYSITFTNDFSRKTWNYFVHEKASAFVVFKKFKALVEKESGHHVKCLRTDRVGEFTSIAFTYFCNLHGVKRQLTTAYIPR